MDKSIEKIIKEILELPHEMRAYLAEKLIESLDTESNFEISEEWKKEIEYRCDQIDKGNAVLRDADEVFKSAHEDLK